MTPIQGRDAKIYGTGYGSKGADGSIFNVTTNGDARDLYAFDYVNGSGPLAGLTLGSDGNYYGAAGSGGTLGLGVLFKTSGDSTYIILHEFSGADGAGPAANPIQASDGNLYGTTSGDGGFFPATIYKYTLAGSFTTIFQFTKTQAAKTLAAMGLSVSDAVRVLLTRVAAEKLFHSI